VYRYLRARWRAGVSPWWVDITLVAVLGIATVWLTRYSWNGPAAVGDAPASHVPPLFGPDAPWPRVVVTDPEPPGWTLFTRDVWLNLLVVTLLIGRRRWPLVCFAAQFGMVLAVDFNNNPASLAAVLIGAYSVAAFGRSALMSMGALLAAGGALASVKDNTWPRLPGWSGVFVILLPIGLLGVAIRAARDRVRASEQRADALRREQEAATRLAVARERARIARELHDVVSHHVSVMTIQAGAAGKVLDADPELARGALAAIEGSGRETMAELRHLLGVLTPGPGDDLLHPQPGLDQLDALIDKVRQAGLPVSARRTVGALPRGLDLTAYRVVQEALTNALRYAPGASTNVAITTELTTKPTDEPTDEPTDDRTDVVIEVVNDAPPAGSSPQPGAGSGTGLLGLAERLRLYGGTLEAGRRVGGGFRVLARLPVEAS
jgi:signal transduction histidine kinase